MDGFRVELVAAEPLVADPVAIEIDEQGQLFVAEMPGYPLDLSRSGRIKLLTDTNADGYPDKSAVWADSLTLPTGLMRWRNGLIVTDAPDVLYLEDTDHDGRADRRTVLLTGFARSNPQHNLNSPQFGPDNWIYLAHEGAITPFVYKKEFGDEGSPIRFPGEPGREALPQNADGRNVRFRPDSREIELLSGETQYGQTFDPWGHQLLTSNANHLFHEVLAARYIARNPHLLVPDATQNISDHGDAAEVYPITENPNHQLLTDKGVITSSCGVTWYNGGAFGAEFERVTFIGEPSHNLVHADVIEPKGASFVAKRLLEKQEFLASTDAWFRPVNFYVGPEGALYVVDYHRQSIEHPEWMSDEMAKSGVLYNGKDKGRIYRIVPERGLPMNWLGTLGLDAKPIPDLVALLDQPNGWVRRTAQRLLYQRNDRTAITPLRQLIAEASYAGAKVPALWLLQALNAADVPTLQTALHDPVAGVRENAIRVAERTQLNGLLPDLLAMTHETNAQVRYQLLCTLGLSKDLRAEAARLAILTRDIDDPWVGPAAIAGAAGHELALYQLARQRIGNVPGSEARQTFFAYLGATLGNRANPAELAQLLRPDSKQGDWCRVAALSGLARLWEHRGVTVPLTNADRLALLPNFAAPPPPDGWQTQLDLLRLAGMPATDAAVQATARQAALLANNPRQDVPRRAAALQWLALYKPAAYEKLLASVVLDKAPEPLRLAAFQSLSRSASRRACTLALTGWNAFTPTLRHKAVDAFLEQPDQIPALLAAIDRQQIRRTDLDWHQQVSLMNYDDQRIRTYARRILAVDENRQVVLAQYQAALAQTGRAVEGKAIFRQVCSSCHQMGGQDGVAFGPDLATLRNRNAQSILTEILHPNHSIADGYDLYTATLRNGQILTGIMARETANALTLRAPGGAETVVSRTDVAKLDKSTQSAMPAGLEQQISIRQMADLLAFIQRGEAK
jgi:putative membrane-bound dehydrogenase-like protein